MTSFDDKIYNAAVVPPVETTPIETLKRLDEFARAGGVVVFAGRQPSLATGYQATEADHAEVQRLAKQIKAFPDLKSGLTPDIAIVSRIPR